MESFDLNPHAGPLGVLAIQGSFPLHLRALERLGIEGRPVKKPSDLTGIKGLILPGGESTVQSLLARKYGLFEALREKGKEGLPMFGTCAGAILLGKGCGTPPTLGLAPVDFLRNAYGTQVDSFTTEIRLKPFDRPFHGIFIRAPKIVGLDFLAPSEGAAPVEVLGEHAGYPILVECGNLLLATFHPELTDDLRVHSYFAARCANPRAPSGV